MLPLRQACGDNNYVGICGTNPNKEIFVVRDFRRTAEPGIAFENQTAAIEPSDCPRCWIVDRLAFIQTTETCHRANNRPDRKAQADQYGKDSSGHHTKH
jgi:hypothetical protein